jgi:hypothetical protein
MFHGSERSGVTTENVGTAKRTAEGRQSGSFGTIVKNEEFLLEEVVGGRERIFGLGLDDEIGIGSEFDYQ